MAGMAEVGRLFNNNELIVAEVLQSAEVMRAAVSYLEPFMTRAETTARGTVILATVKGDVHDIGKNLVEIILSNNGYRVVNLGCRVTPEALIAAYAEHKPHAIGLSGLLVKSTQQMVLTAGDFKAAGIRVPLLVGGAALSPAFTRSQIARVYGEAVCYAKDAMAGLDLMNRIMDPVQRESLLEAHRFDGAPARASGIESRARPVATTRSATVRTSIPLPALPYSDRRVCDVTALADLWRYINPSMLFGRHLGYKGVFEKNLAAHEPKAVELFQSIEDLKVDAAQFMTVKAVWRFFAAERDQNTIQLFAPESQTPVHRFQFARQRGDRALCLSDYVLDADHGHRDSIALFVVTAGAGIRERAAAWKHAGEFFKAHAIQALAIETAEACAEWIHRQIRQDWGFPDPPGMTMQDRFMSRYRGKRYSFGYPACPNLDDQQGMWRLLRPEDIGVALTDGMMMDPEASVSALVFHHPDSRFFSVGGTDPG